MWSQKIFIFTPWRVVGNSERKGLLRPKFLKENVKQNWTFQIRGWWGGSGIGGRGGGGGINPPTTAMGEYGYLLEQQHLSLKQIKNNTTRVQRKSVLPPAIRASRS